LSSGNCSPEFISSVADSGPQYTSKPAFLPPSVIIAATDDLPAHGPPVSAMRTT